MYAYPWRDRLSFADWTDVTDMFAWQLITETEREATVNPRFLPLIYLINPSPSLVLSSSKVPDKPYSGETHFYPRGLKQY